MDIGGCELDLGEDFGKIDRTLMAFLMFSHSLTLGTFGNFLYGNNNVAGNYCF